LARAQWIHDHVGEHLISCGPQFDLRAEPRVRALRL